MYENSSTPEKALCVGAIVKGEDRREGELSLDELVGLAETAGADIIGRNLVQTGEFRSATLIGKGKIEELTALASEGEAGVVFFDNELSPAQQRNLEKIFECKVVDRTGLILDIFAARARTLEGQLQVELAQLNYLLPRLTRMWTHLSRQNGGIGTRGPGEKQLEVDRRKIHIQIDKLASRLKKVRRTRDLHRKVREDTPIPTAAFVGYTNAGKSTLFNRLTEADVFVEDALFATLDPTTRLLELPDSGKVLLSDTVGFINRLPTTLIEAFRATLEEVVQAQVLVQIIDVANPEWEKHIEVVETTLAEIGCADQERIYAFNKVDLLDPDIKVEGLIRRFENSVAFSARTGENIGELIRLIARKADILNKSILVRLSLDRGDLISLIRRQGRVLHEDYDNFGVTISARVSEKAAGRLREFIVEGD